MFIAIIDCTPLAYSRTLIQDSPNFPQKSVVRTRLEGRVSLQVQPKQGVPQGSVLGRNIVEKWCRTWRIRINGFKMEIKHINSEGLTISVFTLGNETCKIKSKTKILGLIVDNACSFKDHTELVVARCKNKWRELRFHCTSRWDLSRNTLTTLYKTLILPTLLYCAPVWSNQNAAKLQTFQAFVNRCILQTRFNPNESAAEVLLGTPPIDIVCQKSKWSLGLMTFGLKLFGLIQLVTWLNFFEVSVSGIGDLA